MIKTILKSTSPSLVDTGDTYICQNTMHMTKQSFLITINNTCEMCLHWIPAEHLQTNMLLSSFYRSLPPCSYTILMFVIKGGNVSEPVHVTEHKLPCKNLMRAALLSVRTVTKIFSNITLLKFYYSSVLIYLLFYIN